MSGKDILDESDGQGHAVSNQGDRGMLQGNPSQLVICLYHCNWGSGWADEMAHLEPPTYE